jgi:hypothetical protein
LGVLLKVTHAPDIGEGLENHLLEVRSELVLRPLGTPFAAVACLLRKSP